MTLNYANRYDEKDTLPFEVVEWISGSELVIREMVADLRKGWRPAMILGHCTNENEQEWDISPDPDALTFRIRLDKHGRWKDVGGKVYRLEAIPVRFHRYSFVGGVYDADASD
jgi:hypothetical protein